MIVAVVLNGWSSSSRKSKTRTNALVEELLIESEVPFELLGLKSSFFKSRSRRIREHIEALQHPERSLLCVGKSLGARNMVQLVLNKLGPLSYRRILLGTLDPNWPESWDLTPNLNGRLLHLTCKVDRASSVYHLSTKPRKQAGALLAGPAGVRVDNFPVTDCDHYSIVRHPRSRKVLRELVKDAAATNQPPTEVAL